MIKRGSIVIHPEYGKGEVIDVRRNGFEFQVNFGNRHRIVRCDEIEEDNPISEAIPSRKPSKTPSPNFKFRQMIEAFRMGIVPEKYVKDFTFGRDAEINSIEQWLNTFKESSKLLIGAYGTGKTHLLNYTHYQAIIEGYAVAYVAMDDTETPFSNPKRVYSQLVQNLEFCSPNDSPLNFQPKHFQDLIEMALAKNKDELKDHSYFKCLREHKEEAIWDWIKGREKMPRPYRYDGKKYDVPGMYDNTKSANIYCYLLSGLGYAAKTIGLKGLLLIFDEAESISSSRSIREQRSYNFLKSLLATARGKSELLNVPKDSGYDYSGHSSVPFLYKQPSGLKVLIAFTSEDDFEDQDEINQVSRLYLESLDHNAINQAFYKLTDLYGKAYNIDSQSLPLDDIHEIVEWQDQPTRILIKSYIEALDIMRFNPDSDPWELLQ